jgi:UPF0755 protein
MDGGGSEATRQDASVSHIGLHVGHSRRRKRRGMGCLAVVVALAVLAGGGFAAYTLGYGFLKRTFAPPADYSGPGTGSVVVQVHSGDTAADIGQTLVKADVVKSVDAFTEAARGNAKSRSIQVGFYRLKHKMPAAAALGVLVNPANMVQASVTIPEGYTVEQIVARLAHDTDLSRKDLRDALHGSIGLPSYAHGNPEGYLFPATYEVAPDATAASVLTAMVDRYKQEAAKLDLSARAEKLGYSAHDVMVVASLVQSEARLKRDFPKVSRVIYNRLGHHMKLQLDSTVHYAVGSDGTVGTSNAERSSSSPYNTYKHLGLPPTPISAPGEEAIKAALDPAQGSWLYFVTTNPDTGLTKFATTYAEHLKHVAEFKHWCAQSEHC